MNTDAINSAPTTAATKSPKHLPNIPAPRLTPLAAACLALGTALIGGGLLALLT